MKFLSPICAPLRNLRIVFHVDDAGIRRTRSGSILLECLLALALLVAAGVTVLGAMDHATAAAGRVADEKDAMDVAVNAMSRVECGDLSIENAQGPSAKWHTGVRERIKWYISADTFPSEFDGLTLVSLRVFRDDPGTTGTNSIPVASLHQLVRLGGSGAGGGGRKSSTRLGGVQ